MINLDKENNPEKYFIGLVLLIFLVLCISYIINIAIQKDKYTLIIQEENLIDNDCTYIFQKENDRRFTKVDECQKDKLFVGKQYYIDFSRRYNPITTEVK